LPSPLNQLESSLSSVLADFVGGIGFESEYVDGFEPSVT
jgi:hypothetical protein